MLVRLRDLYWNRRYERLGDEIMQTRNFNDFSVRALNRNSVLSSNLTRTRNRLREDIGTLRGRFRASGEVNKDEPDIYRFRLRRNTELKVALQNEESLGFFDLFGTRKRVQATLQDRSSNRIRATDRIRPEDEDEFRVRLRPGIYTVRITGRSENDVEYELRLSTRRDNFDDDFDDFDDD
jgi:hypothetical protein